MALKYTGKYTNEISFPLGGIGAGCIGLAGNGRLIDWEIFNRPNKGSLNGMSHFAVKAECNGKLLDTRILQGDLQPPYTGEMGCPEFSGFGWGPRRGNLCGMQHFRNHIFKGQYPMANIDFGGESSWPGLVSLEAWSPFIPCNDYDSSFPGAFFEVEIKNTTEKIIDYTVVGAVSNPFGSENALNKVIKSGSVHQLTLTNTSVLKDDINYGDITLSIDEKEVSYQEYWYRGVWCDDLEVYYQDLTKQKRFINRSYTEGAQVGFTGCDTGHLAVHFKLQPEEKHSVRFLITWNVPNCTNYWRSGIKYEQRMKNAGVKNSWKNWYSKQWDNSLVSGLYALQNWSRLYNDTKLFQQSLFGSSLPEVALEAVSANLAILKSPTCLRLEDGTFYGWEGSGTYGGICEGSCTHVWNYAQALPFLFPALERSMRQANYKYSVDKYGGSHFRILLPLGMSSNIDDFRPCADGQFGDIIKTYRDWKICGDDYWLKDLWTTIRSTIEYAWSENNTDRWDLDKTGVLWGRQHHTLDMELFGPNAWLTGYYLAALKAITEMAPVCGDIEFGEECQLIFERGKAWTDENLFKGEYYCQNIDLNDRETLIPYDDGSFAMVGGKTSDAYWSNEHQQIKYQIGEGCQINSTIAQWHANIYGLGEIFNPEKLRSSLEATFRYNYKKSMRDVANPWRVYTLNDEAGLLICSWPEHVSRPSIPLPYSQEDQSGYTYSTAIEMIQTGMIDEGITLIKAVRDRYDGLKRNPYNEIECGSNYARSMASYSLIPTFSGFLYNMSTNMIGFKPIYNGNKDFRCFWSLDSGWGMVLIDNMKVELKVLYGRLLIREYRCNDARNIATVIIDSKEVGFNLVDNISIIFDEVLEIKEKLKLVKKNI